MNQTRETIVNQTTEDHRESDDRDHRESDDRDHRESDEHWICFSDNVGQTSEWRGGANMDRGGANMGFSERIDTALNGVARRGRAAETRWGLTVSWSRGSVVKRLTNTGSHGTSRKNLKTVVEMAKSVFAVFLLQ